jgi:hypothetical protein
MQHKFMLYTLLLLGIILVVSLSACGCEPESVPPGPAMQWYKTFGEGTDTYGNSVQQTTDGGYIICGSTGSVRSSGVDVWLIKTDAEGNIIWDKTFGSHGTDDGSSVQQTTDGGYILCGTTEGGIWLIKTDAEGNIIWDKTFGGWGYSVQQTTDGGYIVCGQSDEHLRLIKTDAEGNTLWDKTFVGQRIDQGNSVQQTTDGGYIVCGWTRPLVEGWIVGKPNVWLIKTDAEGNIIWDKMFGGELYAEAASVQQTTDGGYIICGIGETEETIGEFGALLIKTDAEGNIIWEGVFYSSYRDYSVYGYSVQQTSDGGYSVCGKDRLYSPWLMKVDADGNRLWDKTFKEIKGIADGRSIQQTTDGGYIICGMVYSAESSHVLLFKVAPEQ